MSYQVLARKWRPKAFEQLVGQPHVVRALVNGLDQDRVHHAFLLTGTRGVGKTTIARILAKCLNCEEGVTSTPCGACSSCVDIDEGRFIDMLEIDAASRTKVEDTRDLLDNVQYTPTRGRFKVYIIDEVHMLSTSSFNALLKTLEEPPPHVKFVLATTDPHKIPVTILSRCLRFNLKRLLPDQISAYLESILLQEATEFEAEALIHIARAADGSMRDGLSLLDQAIAFGGGSVKTEEVRSMLGSIDQDRVLDLLDALIDQRVDTILDIIDELAALASDFDRLLVQLAENLHRVVLLQQAPDYHDNNRSDWQALTGIAGRISPEDAQLYYQIALLGHRDLDYSPDPRSGTEMTLLRMLAFRPADTAPREQLAATRAKTAKPKPERSREVVAGARPPGPPEPPPVQAGPDWKKTLGELQLGGPVRELARNLALDKRDNEIWNFSIPAHLKHLGSEKSRAQLEQALATFSGQPAVVRINTGDSDNVSPAAQAQDELELKLSTAEQSIQQDPTVQSLQKDLGASLVSGSIKPV